MNNKRKKGEGKRVKAALLPFALSLFPFILLATLNSAGYRYGASDQAFYGPAVLKRADPALFPRDSALIDSQAKLTLVDDVVGPLARVSGVSLPVIFAVLHLAALGSLAWAAARIGGSLYRTQWAVVGLMAALTLRHAITRSGTNTLEGYFHPRQLSFAIGALAVSTFLRGGTAAALALVAGAWALHPTTGLWFAIWLGIAAFVADRRSRLPVLAIAAAAVLAGGWALTNGPLAGRLTTMDQLWLETLTSKDYLFPLDWPAFAWVINLSYVPLILWVYSRRRSAGVLVPREGALVAGCLSLLLVFAVALPLNSARFALAIQLQPARIFWMLDFLAVIYVVWALAEGLAATEIRARMVTLGLAVLSVVRGSYVMFVEFPDRPIARLGVEDNDWGRAMAWARASDRRSGWLADPVHAVRYGTSVRVAGERDVFVEAIKDAAVGMYDRTVALRTRERSEEIGDFGALTPDRARAIAARYGLDYLVTERELTLPIAFSSGAIRIYRLR
jgi:hypothetical protein